MEKFEEQLREKAEEYKSGFLDGYNLCLEDNQITESNDPIQKEYIAS